MNTYYFYFICYNKLSLFHPRKENAWIEKYIILFGNLSENDRFLYNKIIKRTIIIHIDAKLITICTFSNRINFPVKK